MLFFYCFSKAKTVNLKKVSLFSKDGVNLHFIGESRRDGWASNSVITYWYQLHKQQRF